MDRRFFLFTPLALTVGLQTGAKEPKKFLFIGDSITDGNRGRNDDPNHILGHGYVFSIATRLGAKYPEKGLTFINKGISGDTVTDLAKRWDADVLDLQPDVLTIMVGINDFHKYVSSSKPAYSPENYGKVLYELISNTRQKLPECKIVIMSPFLLPVGNTYGALYKSHLALFESYHAKSSVSGIEWIDLQKLFLEKGQKPSMAYWVWDGIHPTYSGHELITQAWLKAMGRKVKFIGRV